MKNTYYLLLLLISLLLPDAGTLYAQKQNNVWVGGVNAQIQFTNGYPEQVATATPATSNQIWTGNASVSNSAGQLLFYTNGKEVRDINHTTMGNGFLSTFFSVPGWSNHYVQIVPFPQDTNRFYVFYLTENLSWKLSYSVVDMTLGGGLGDVVSSQKDILLASNLTGHLGVVPGNDCNFWLVTHDQFSNAFKSFEITGAGINTTPVLTHVGITPGTYIRGGLKFSPDRKRMAMGVESGSGTTLYRFDPGTGRMSDPVFLTNTAFTAGFCFSPDNSKLYLIGGTPPVPSSWWPPLWQFELSSFNASAINSSQTFISDSISNNYGLYDLELGPDNKIYSMWNGMYFDNISALARIEFPNNTGTACNLTTQYLPMYVNATPPNTYDAFAGCRRLHTDVPAIFKDTLYSTFDTLICPGSVWKVTIAGDSITWNDGTHDAVRELSEAGQYIVAYKPNCHWTADTINIGMDPELTGFSLGPDTILCAATPITLSPVFPDSSSHIWQDGSTGPEFTMPDEGTTFVQLTKGSCTITDSFTVQIPRLHFDLGSLPVQCEGTSVVLSPGGVSYGITYLWQDGSTASQYKVSAPGIYWLELSKENCSFSDTIKISYENCDCPVLVPNAFSPNGDGLNDVFLPNFICTGIKGYMLEIFDRWGSRIYQSVQPDKGWDGRYRQQTMETGTYFFRLSYTNKNGRQEYRKGDCTLIR